MIVISVFGSELQQAWLPERIVAFNVATKIDPLSISQMRSGLLRHVVAKLYHVGIIRPSRVLKCYDRVLHSGDVLKNGGENIHSTLVGDQDLHKTRRFPAGKQGGTVGSNI